MEEIRKAVEIFYRSKNPSEHEAYIPVMADDQVVSEYSIQDCVDLLLDADRNDVNPGVVIDYEASWENFIKI